jgi:ABC-type cobalamin/Fe3+-siderophores transport system ATPase subunit
MDEIVFERVIFRYPETGTDVFTDLSLTLPGGIVSLVGQNGTGKSTLLLLAAGSLLPTSGSIRLRGIDTRKLQNEEERHQLVSFVYQNMEFESEEPIADLLNFVSQSGTRARGDDDFIKELVDVFELSAFLDRRMQEVSKGELQRTILAFSLLFGSPVLMMDEPIFALEDYQKRRAMDYLCRYVKREGISLYYSVHELEISEHYSDHLLLFSRDKEPRLGPTRELFTRDTIEKAYEVPFFMLKRREELYRKYLVELLKTRGSRAGEPPRSEPTS